MRFGGVPIMGLHPAYPDMGFFGPKEPSLGSFCAYDDEEDENGVENGAKIAFPSPKLPNFANSRSPSVGKSSRNFAHRSVFLSHSRLQKRLKKTLYYGKHPKTERPSLPMTGLLVNLFAGCGVQDSLERLDMDSCSSMAFDACISPHAVVLAMIYVERLSKNNPEFLYSIPSSHLFLVTTMVASKYLYDVQENEGVYNDEWASSARMELEELNRLEVSFLNAVDWSLFVSDEDFENTLLKVEKAIALNQGNARGWFSVTDLVTLGSRSDLLSKLYEQVVQQIASVFFVSLTTYLLAALTMTAAVIVGNKATESLAGLMDSVSAPASGSSPSAAPIDSLGQGHRANSSVETIGVDLDLPLDMDTDDHDLGLGLGSPRVCAKANSVDRLANKREGRAWCDLRSALEHDGMGSHGRPPGKEGNGKWGLGFGFGLGLGLGLDLGLGMDSTLDGFFGRPDAVPPLLAGLDDFRREVPQSTRVLVR